MPRRTRNDTHGRISIVDRSLRPAEKEHPLAVSDEHLDLVLAILEDADGPVTQAEVCDTIVILLDCPTGTAIGIASRALLWLYREEMVDWKGAARTERGGNTNAWALA